MPFGHYQENPAQSRSDIRYGFFGRLRLIGLGRFTLAIIRHFLVLFLAIPWLAKNRSPDNF